MADTVEENWALCKMKALQPISLFFLLSLNFSLQAQQIGDPGCDRLVLVSAYFGNNIKIYDGCDGSFIRDLDSNGYLQGPQAIAVDPQGRLVVASETNGRLVRYHRDSLTYDRVLAGDDPATAMLEPPPVPNPTGLVISADGRMFAGSYSSHTVAEIDPATGTVLGNVVTQGHSGIQGPDTGMLLDGSRLLVPGFDSSTVVEADINLPGSDSLLVSAGAGGINAPRTVLKQANGNLLVTSWRSNKVLEFNGSSGSFIREVSTAVERPTGMAFESADVLLLASDKTNNVSRVRISDGEVLGTFIASVSGPTFILVLQKQISALASNRSFWLVGVGEIDDKSISTEEVILTTGGVFGDALDPGAIAEAPWGSLLVEFLSCNSGTVSWHAIEGQFGDGSYSIQRIAADPYGDACLDEGFDNILDNAWMSGHWFGGATRNGEGFSINIINGGLAVITWYSYLPN